MSDPTAETNPEPEHIGPQQLVALMLFGAKLKELHELHDVGFQVLDVACSTLEALTRVMNCISDWEAAARPCSCASDLRAALERKRGEPPERT
jgi:hypothetical protein